MRFPGRDLCAALLFVYPSWLGVRSLVDTWRDLRPRRLILDRGLASAPPGAERDYLFLRDVGRHLRADDRLVIVKDPLSELIDIAIPLLAAGWYGPTEVLFDLPAPDKVAAWVHEQVTDPAGAAMLTTTLEKLRRPPDEVARILGQASVVVAWTSGWRPDGGLLLVGSGRDLTAWRLR